MHSIPRNRLSDGEIIVSSRGDMVTVASYFGILPVVIGMSKNEALSVARAIIRECGEISAEQREGVRHALMHLDLPKEIDDGIVDYD